MSATRRCWGLFAAIPASFALSLTIAATGCQAVKNGAPGGNPPTKTLVSVSVSPGSASILVGATQQFSATAKYSDGSTADVSGSASWTSSTQAVATVNVSGLAKGVAAGSDTIAASLSGVSGNASLTVTVVTRTVTSIAVTPPTASVLVGATVQYSATATYNDGSTGNVTATATWMSTTPTVATVNSTGLATALSSGTTSISASLSGISGSASLTVASVSITISPASAAIAPSGTQQFSATVQGLTNTALAWSVDGVAGGNSTTGTITSSGMYTAPFATGAHTVTATSAANSSFSGSATLTVINTSPGAVLTYHNDDARDGAFTQETTLTTANVNSIQFGKLFSYAVDGQVYAQPLYLPQISIAGGTRDVVYVVTQNNSVYAFDATGTKATAFWEVNLGAHVTKDDVTGVNPYVGILSTPVIDATTGTMYVLAETAGTNPPFFLHALDVTTGAEKFGGPVAVTGSVTGTEGGGSSHTITLESSCYQRMALALDPVTNAIYIPFGSCTHGWVLAYNKTTLQQTAIFNATPNNNGGGGLWSSGGAAAIDDTTGDLYLLSGVDLGDDIAPGNSIASGYNDAFLRLKAADLSVLDYFMPDDNPTLAANDVDLGGGGNILMPSNSSSTPHETLGGGKDGNIFVVNRAHMGGYNFEPPSNSVIQTVPTGTQQYNNIFSTPAYWNGSLYYHPNQDVLHAFSWNVGTGMLSTQPTSSSATSFSMHGATPSLSANGTLNGIVWDIDNTNYNQNDPAQSGPSVLHAYDAINVATELYNSSQAGSRDTAGLALKFTVPTIAGGKVFVPTGNELDVYGLLP